MRLKPEEKAEAPFALAISERMYINASFEWNAGL
jgi:hypothetical protein